MSSRRSSNEGTQQFVEAARAEARSSQELFVAAYDLLRSRARSIMSHERSDHTLQATALVNEVFLKIVSSGAQFHNEDHFIAACVAAMRQVLIDHARKRSRLKRKHSGTELPADQVVLAYGASSREVLEIDDAIRRLAELDPESAKVVELRFFGGLSWDGVRKAAHVSKREARSRWEFARRWLHRELYK